METVHGYINHWILATASINSIHKIPKEIWSDKNADILCYTNAMLDLKNKLCIMSKINMTSSRLPYRISLISKYTQDRLLKCTKCGARQDRLLCKNG